MNENTNLNDPKFVSMPEDKHSAFPMQVIQTTQGEVVSYQNPKKEKKARVKLNMPKFNLGSANKIFKIMIILLVVIVVLSIALFFAGFGLDAIRNMRKGSLNNPQPTPSATPVSVVNSKYANDEDMLLINQRIKELQESINDTKLRDDNLRIPSVDWEINFEN